MNLRKLFCKHDYKQIAKHQSSSQNLWRCDKCGLLYIQHWGIDIGYSCEKPNLDGWVEAVPVLWWRSDRVE